MVELSREESLPLQLLLKVIDKHIALASSLLFVLFLLLVTAILPMAN